VVGCAAISYSRGAAFDQADSIWRVYLDEVLPATLWDADASPHVPLLIESTGTYIAWHSIA
jgi:hypothetical protein